MYINIIKKIKSNNYWTNQSGSPDDFKKKGKKRKKIKKIKKYFFLKKN